MKCRILSIKGQYFKDGCNNSDSFWVSLLQNKRENLLNATKLGKEIRLIPEIKFSITKIQGDGKNYSLC